MPGAADRWGYRGKRAFDVAFTVAGALPATAIGLLCAAAIKATSAGPILFRQERVGRDGRTFTLLKFRSMVHRPDNATFPDAAQITPVGRLLRQFSLDELPQLINVARGEMSIVGPRPTLRYQVDRYDARQRRRLAVNPGLTGLAQVRGRNEIGWQQRIEHDLEYIEHQSLMLDLAIVGQTVRQLLARRGVEGHPADDPISRIDVDGVPASRDPRGGSAHLTDRISRDPEAHDKTDGPTAHP